MSNTMTLIQLRTAVRQRADMVTADETKAFVSGTELTSYINQSAYELYDLLIQEFGDDYFVANPYAITTDGTSSSYSLPTDFYKLLGVDLAFNGTNWSTLKPFNFAERNRQSLRGLPISPGRVDLRYRLKGNQLWLTPTPQGGQNLQLWYIPRFTELSADSDTYDGISGWTEYVIVDAAIKCLQKEESDCSVLMAQKAALIKRITEAAENRDAGMPSTVADTDRSGDSDAYGFRSGWDL